MRRGSLCVGVLVLVLYMAGTVSAQMSDQAVAEFRSLGWQPATSLDLSASRSEITNLPGYSAVVGADAQRARKLEDADTEPAEAEVVNPTTGAEAVFLYIASGYVSSDDWGNLNPTALLDQIRQNSETANANRRSQGLPELHVIGWIQPPTLNPDTHTVFWSFSGSGSDGAKIINAVALKLGRYGFERITFIDEAVNIDTAPQNLLLIANAHHFDAGARYDDYIAGSDRSAAYGVAGLVAGLLGVKVLKVAAAGGPLLLLKKAGWVLLLPLVWLWRLVRGKKTRPMAAPTTSVPRVEPKIAAPSNTNV